MLRGSAAAVMMLLIAVPFGSAQRGPDSPAPTQTPDFSGLLAALGPADGGDHPRGPVVEPIIEVYPEAAVAVPAEPLGETLDDLSSFSVTPAPEPPAPQPPAVPEGDWVVNINTAPADLLAAVPGLGVRRAEAVVAHREANGPFRRVSEITDVFGITEEIFEALSPRLTVSGPTTFRPGNTGPATSPTP